MSLRQRLARWLIGPHIRIPEDGAWLVTHDTDTKTTIAIRVAEWSGEISTTLPGFDVTDTTYIPFASKSTGTFSGRFG